MQMCQFLTKVYDAIYIGLTVKDAHAQKESPRHARRRTCNKVNSLGVTTFKGVAYSTIYIGPGYLSR